jgi:hypothetical protein
MRLLYTGDTMPITVSILTDGAAVQIPTTATIRASLVNLRGDSLAGPWTVTEADGGNWTYGIIAVPVDGADTADLEPQACRFQIQIDNAGTSITRQTTETISLRWSSIASTI